MYVFLSDCAIPDSLERDFEPEKLCEQQFKIVSFATSSLFEYINVLSLCRTDYKHLCIISKKLTVRMLEHPK